jgi:glucose/arabinose dehydrogenase
MKKFLLFFFTHLLFIQFSLAGEFPEGFVEKFIAGGLDPTALTIAPDGRIFLVEKNGAVWIIENDVLLPETFLKLEVDIQNERGLGGITLDPDFGTNQYIYLYYNVANQNRNRNGR